MYGADVHRVIAAYRGIVRLYCYARFGILRQVFLDAIGAHLPASGRVLDIGCGFGLFSLYYALRNPALRLEGIDVDPGRVALATATAARLGLPNVTFRVGDARELTLAGTFDGAYMLDVIHHVPEAVVPELLDRLHDRLAPGATLVAKDVDASQGWKRRFTHLLDFAMAPRSPVHYWTRERLASAIACAGFEVSVRALPDFLPYPHVLYACVKRP